MQRLKILFFLIYDDKLQIISTWIFENWLFIIFKKVCFCSSLNEKDFLACILKEVFIIRSNKEDELGGEIWRTGENFKFKEGQN